MFSHIYVEMHFFKFFVGYTCKIWLHHYRFSTFNFEDLRFDFQSFSIIVCVQRTRGVMWSIQNDVLPISDLVPKFEHKKIVQTFFKNIRSVPAGVY